ncbi:hypothetical protein N7532_011783 [Penicillium argentinense]|uniref:Uncharacterized protein n=1 Tax=Penicillium argentinense TaxID=1131581 RepID=A0A9W9JVA3_9EURO|nr:uncharacterized protein N7532_011783 [Penicillium argentinense]KAJ5082740.1 hypothetical protein N7532_011783 [Penicillium argentinense]
MPGHSPGTPNTLRSGFRAACTESSRRRALRTLRRATWSPKAGTGPIADFPRRAQPPTMELKCADRLYRRDDSGSEGLTKSRLRPLVLAMSPSGAPTTTMERAPHFTRHRQLLSADGGCDELYKPATVARRLARARRRSRAMCPPLAWRSTTPNDRLQRGECLGGGGVAFPSCRGESPGWPGTHALPSAIPVHDASLSGVRPPEVRAACPAYSCSCGDFPKSQPPGQCRPPFPSAGGPESGGARVHWRSQGFPATDKAAAKAALMQISFYQASPLQGRTQYIIVGTALQESNRCDSQWPILSAGAPPNRIGAERDGKVTTNFMEYTSNTGAIFDGSPGIGGGCLALPIQETGTVA